MKEKRTSLRVKLISLLAMILVSGCERGYQSDFCLKYQPIIDVDSVQVGKMNQIYACECMNLTRDEMNEWCR